jgi:hypothetical protein
VEINVLGLRNLKPALGWVPVNKAYVIFDLSSLQLPGESLKVRNVQTQPGEPGPNPNLNAIIKFTCNMPTDPLYSPALSCSVFDCMFMGLSQPLLGSFSINLGEMFGQRGGKSVFSMMNIGLSKIKETKSQIVPATDQPVDLFSTPSKAPAQDDFLTKSQQLPSHSSASGVRRGQSEQMRGELTYPEAKVGGFVREPKYEKNPKTGRVEELAPPDENFFMQIGYDRVPGEGTMHYRYVLKTEMEKSPFMGKSPFNTFDIIRGEQSNLDSYFDLNSGESNIETVGKFKGLIRIVKTNEMEERRQRVEAMKKEREQLHLKLASHEDFKTVWHLYAQQMEAQAAAEADEEFDDIAKRLLVQSKVLVRVYVLDAFGLAPKDSYSQSDPYVRIKLGSKEWFNDKANYQLDNPDPKIYKMFELETALPGESMLKIQFFDHDDVFSDQKIGQTVIDLEDRFFSNKWLSLKEKPIETRPLYSKVTKVPQGGVRLWVEITPLPLRTQLKVKDVSVRPPAEFECRIVVWGTEGVANFDDEGTSDIFIRSWINEAEPKETDTHYRCMNGKGSFNWRMVYPLILTDNMKNTATVQIWDRDILSKNDFIAEASFSFDSTAKTAWETGGRIKRMGDGGGMIVHSTSEKFWIDCMRRKADGKLEQGGRVQLSLELVPKAQVAACPVGEGRNEPNVDPFLPPPVGRFSWSWNPCKLIAQTVGPEYRIKACLICCLALCLALCVFMFPMIVSNVFTNLVFAAV